MTGTQLSSTKAHEDDTADQATTPKGADGVGSPADPAGKVEAPGMPALQPRPGWTARVVCGCIDDIAQQALPATNDSDWGSVIAGIQDECDARTPLERMAVAEMFMSYYIAANLIKRGMATHHPEAQMGYLNQSMRWMKLYSEQMEACSRRRGGAQSSFNVGRMDFHNGGQAVLAQVLPAPAMGKKQR